MERKLSDAKTVALAASLTALGLILSFVESQIPALISVPGIKLGLANLVTLFALYRLGAPYALGVSVLRVSLSSLLFGSVTSFIYGMSGAIISFGIMLLMKRLHLNVITVSILGGASHNIGQIAAAALVMRTGVVVYYLPYLLLFGTIFGAIIGVIGAILINKVKI